MDVLLITGPAGVGKTTVAHELSHVLKGRQIAHALIDTDELDHVYPTPPDPRRVTQEALSAVWGVLGQFGAERLILVGVYLDADEEREWITNAIPHADFMCVRLLASASQLKERVLRREIGAGATEQIERTMRQLTDLAQRPGGGSTHTIHTDGRPPTEVASDIASLWLREAD